METEYRENRKNINEKINERIRTNKDSKIERVGENQKKLST